MKIVSTTLLGPGSLEAARDALVTIAGQVDMSLIIADPRDRDDATSLADWARRKGLRCEDICEPWVNFSHNRNAALRLAAEYAFGRDGGLAHGEDGWAVTADSDERLQLPADLRDQLAQTTANVLMVPYMTGAYSKERLFRLPATYGRWEGPTHEAFLPPAPATFLQGAYFAELAKTEAEDLKKSERDAALLAPYARQHPTEPRWLYFLGRCYWHLHKYAAAVDALNACWRLDGWEEESAHAAIIAAHCMGEQAKWREAQEWACRALTRAPWMPQAACMAAAAAFEREKYDNTISFAELAIPHGLYAGLGTRRARVMTPDDENSFERPYELQAFALAKLGRMVEADEMARTASLAKRKRLGLPTLPGLALRAENETATASTDPAGS